MYLTFIAHISPHVVDSFGGPCMVVTISLGMFCEFENIFGSEMKQEKLIYKKAMLGVQLQWIDKGGKRKKNTQENNLELMMYMLVVDGMIGCLSNYVVLELPTSHAMAAVLKLQPQIIAHVLHNDK